MAALAPPLSLAPPTIAAAPERADSAAQVTGPSLLSRTVIEPAAQVADIISSAAGGVGAAGSWAVSRAAELLPRW